MNDYHHAGAFVVQFRTSTNSGHDCIEGRVEHIASGLTAHFTSPGELIEILARLWTNVRATEPADTTGHL